MEPAEAARVQIYWMLRKMWWAFGLISLMGIGCWYLWRADPAGMYYMILPALIFGMMPPLLFYGTYSAAARNCRKQEQGDREYVFTDTQFCTITTDGRGELNWTAVRAVVETQRLFQFIVGNGLVITLPKRVLKEDAIRRIRHLAQDRGYESGGLLALLF